MSIRKEYSASKIVPLIGAVCKRIPRGKGWFARLAGTVLFKQLQYKYITTRYGAKMVVDPRNLDFYCTMYRWDWSWEHWVFDTISWVLPDDGVFYDIGGNVGYMSIEVAQRHKKAQIYCFEPIPTLANTIDLSAKLNGFEDRLNVFEIALSDVEDKTSTMTVPAHQGHASLEKNKLTKKGSKLSVQVSTLDRLRTKNNIPLPDVIKIDIEGHEKHAIGGALDSLSGSKPHLVFEVSSQQDLLAIQELLLKVTSYRFFYARGSYRSLSEISPETKIADKIDVIAINPKKQGLPSTLASQLA